MRAYAFTIALHLVTRTVTAVSFRVHLALDGAYTLSIAEDLAVWALALVSGCVVVQSIGAGAVVVVLVVHQSLGTHTAVGSVIPDLVGGADAAVGFGIIDLVTTANAAV